MDYELFVVCSYCSDSAGGVAVKHGTYAALPNAQSDVQPAGQSSFNHIASRDCQNCQIGKAHRGAQDRQLWRDGTCFAHT